MSGAPRSRRAQPGSSKSSTDRRAAPGSKARGKPPAKKLALATGSSGGVGILARVSPEQLEQALGVVLALNGPADTLLGIFFAGIRIWVAGIGVWLPKPPSMSCAIDASTPT